ncbi:MAG TPA: ABC transporter permease [Chitinophagaceae bacterium]|nr:ABC transporter permease [Chitinophagaceae bacterium]
MFRYLEIIWSSLKMALQEFRSNKLRTFLSLLGITFGIFCIISVLSTIGSMEVAIQKDIKALGSNTVYIDKWDYSGGDDYPWWKYTKRPEPKYEEMEILRAKVPAASNIAFTTNTQANIEYEDDVLTNVNYYGITEDFINIQPVEILAGRYLIQSDYDYASNSVVMGYTVAEKLFGRADRAFGKQIKMRNGKTGVIVGVLRKKGASMLGGWDFDNSMLMPSGFMKQMIREEWANPVILVQGKENVSMEALKDELTGAMRSLRKLRPTEEDDFALNDVDTFSDMMSSLFAGVNQGGWFIAGLSLIVGMFGVANIMFVTVRERTSQIGLKKAIGAKRSTILMEFLLESAFLCIIGGLIGLILVFILTQIFSALIGFPVFISLDIITLAVGICIVVGVLAGIIPATIAARMDPVVAIRSK